MGLDIVVVVVAGVEEPEQDSLDSCGQHNDYIMVSPALLQPTPRAQRANVGPMRRRALPCSPTPEWHGMAVMQGSLVVKPGNRLPSSSCSWDALTCVR